MITHPALAAAPHAFFTRQGGVSEGGYASLNCSVSGRDDPTKVQENRARAAHALGFSVSALTGAYQVHGPDVAVVEAPWPDDVRPQVDALVTRTPGVLLGIVTADCAPVLFLDATGRVAGAAHAGWRGAVLGVLEATAQAMRDLGATAISAVVGPCIGQPSYQVRADLRDEVLARDADDARFFAPDGDGFWRFDLPGYCVARLQADGVQAAATGHDTLTDAALFFSHRRRTLGNEGVIGHQLSAIGIAT